MTTSIRLVMDPSTIIALADEPGAPLGLRICTPGTLLELAPRTDLTPGQVLHQVTELRRQVADLYAAALARTGLIEDAAYLVLAAGLIRRPS